jgi:hypothetical protein
LADLPTRRIATFHDAFSYFAEAYGLDVVATFEPYPGLEPSPRFVIEFQRNIRAAAVRVVFTEPQRSIDALRPIARDLGVTLAVLDPLGGLPGRESYIDLLRFDARCRGSRDAGPNAIKSGRARPGRQGPDHSVRRTGPTGRGGGRVQPRGGADRDSRHGGRQRTRVRRLFGVDAPSGLFAGMLFLAARGRTAWRARSRAGKGRR